MAEVKRKKKDDEWGATFGPKYDEFCRKEFERLTRKKKGPAKLSKK